MLAVSVFAAAAVVSLLTSWLLVSRLERIGARLGLSEALLGIVAALAADAPEITASFSALTSHQQRIGAGVVLGSNVFNLAALLGLGAVVAGRINLHRKVIALSGTVAMLVAVVCVLVVSGIATPLAGLIAAVVVLGVYLLVLGTRGRLPLFPAAWQAWLRSAVREEETELEDAITPIRARWPDLVTAAVALAVVVAASVSMERAASSLGTRFAVPEIITGGLVLAAVTSLPNAVAAIYLASRDRGAATLSTALNSNSLNVVAGLLLPGTLLGLGRPSDQALLVTAWYAGLSLAVLALAWQHRGLSRRAGAAVIAAYAAFTASLFVSGNASPGGRAVILGLGAFSSLVLLAAALPARLRRAARGEPHPSGPEKKLGPTAWSAQARGRTSLLPGWSARQLWAVSVIASSVVAAVDAATGHRAILIGLLTAGPCIALLTGRSLLTAITGCWVCALAVVLGLPDGIWITVTHLIFISAVAIVAIVAVAASAIIGRTRHQC